MSSILRRQAQRIRGLVYIRHVIQAAGCGTHPADLEKWGREFEAEQLRTGFAEYSRRWSRYLKGALVGNAMRQLLMRQFPDLGTVLDNTLWAILAWLEHPSSDPDLFARRLIFNDQKLTRRHGVLIQQRMTMANWTDLAIWLAILASHDNRWRLVRQQVRRYFTATFLLMCSEPELSGAARLLFTVLRIHFSSGRLARAGNWPDSLHAFKRLLKQVSFVKTVVRRSYPKTHIRPSVLLAVLLSDCECRRVFRPGCTLQEVWPRCRRIASFCVRKGSQSTVGFAPGLA